MHRAEPPPSYRALLEIPTLGRILLGMSISRIGGSMLGVAIVLFTLERFGSPFPRRRRHLRERRARAGHQPDRGSPPGPARADAADHHRPARRRGVPRPDRGAGHGRHADALTLVLVTGVAGLTAPLSSVGLRTLFPILVPRRLWERVNALDSNGYVVATLIGPPLAGLLVQVIGGPATLVVIAGLFPCRPRVRGHGGPPHESALTGLFFCDAWQGFAYTLRVPTLRGLGVDDVRAATSAGASTRSRCGSCFLDDLEDGEMVVGRVSAVSRVTGRDRRAVAGPRRVRGRRSAVRRSGRC